MGNNELNMKTVLSPAFSKIWDNSLLGVMVIDRHGVIQYMNHLLIRTDDLQDEDIIGQKMVDFYPLERDCHVSIQTLETGKPTFKKTVVYYTQKKKLVNSLCSSFPLISHGQVEGVIHFALNLQTSQALLDQHQDKAATKVPFSPQDAYYSFDSLIGKDHRFQNR